MVQSSEWWFVTDEGFHACFWFINFARYRGNSAIKITIDVP